MTAKSVRIDEKNRPNASETSEQGVRNVRIAFRHSDDAPDFGRFPILGGSGLIDRMTAEAETDRAATPYGTATFFAEDGTITHVNVTSDRVVEAVDRICKRLWPDVMERHAAKYGTEGQ